MDVDAVWVQYESSVNNYADTKKAGKYNENCHIFKVGKKSENCNIFL